MTTPFGGQPQQATPFGQTATQAVQTPATSQTPFGAPAAQQAAPGGAPWASPSSIPDVVQGDKFEPSTLVGALLLITVKDYVTGLTTTFTKAGETSDMIRADIAIIGAKKAEAGGWMGCPPEQSTVLHDAGIFQGRLIGKLKGKVGTEQNMVLARLSTVPTSGNPAYELLDPSPEDQAAAMAFYNASSQAPPF